MTPTYRSRSLRFVAAAGVLAITVSTLSATSLLAPAPAQAAPGDAFSPADPYVFIAQDDPTQLYKARTDASGTTSFEPEGTPTGALAYNATAYNTADNFIYATTRAAAEGFPANSLVRIGQGGVVTSVAGAVVQDAVVGAFGPGGDYYTLTGPNLQRINVTTGAIVSNLTMDGGIGAGGDGGYDFAYMDGYFWSLGSQNIVRLDPVTGETARWASSTMAIPATPVDQAGAAWTYGNGNLGFSFNGSGEVYQVAVTDPSSAAPTFTLVSTNSGPASAANDGTASPGQPTDLAIVKSGDETLMPGGTVSYTLTVTNNGPGNSSGFVVNDAVPAPLTGAASPDAGCTVTGNDISCVGGRLVAGESVTYTVTASVPSGANNSLVTNTATVTSNEDDPDSSNNTSDHSAPIVPQVSCMTDANIFNTGYDAATGGVLADEAKDTNWQVSGRFPTSSGVALPPEDATWEAANVGNIAPGSWAASPYGNAQWISQQTISDSSQGGVSGDWYYRFQFDLAAEVDPAQFALAMNFMADNAVAEVFVNGVPQSGKTTGLPQFPLGPDNGPGSHPYFSPGFHAAQASETFLNDDWRTGLNALVVQIKSGPDAEGFNAQMQPSVLCLQPSYTVNKSASVANVQEGGTVTYTVAVENTGNVAYTVDTPASFTDDLSGVLDDAAYNGDAAVVYSGSSSSEAPVRTGSTLAWAGPLAVGETATITYSVTVRMPDNGDHVLSNAVIPGDGGTCADCATSTEVQSFSVTKTADTNEVVPGDIVTYTLTVTNTGQVDYTAGNPAALTDDLSDVIDDATYNGDADGGATYLAPTLSWSGPLAVGATETITYSVTVDAPPLGDQRLQNAVVTSNGGDCPTGTDNPACRVDIPSGSFTVAKEASTVEAGPGDTVTYRVTVTNTGTVDYTDAAPAAFADDLSNVIDDASYNGDANQGATVTGTTLRWTGALPVGDDITITYSVTVNSVGAGDDVLRNFVRPTSPGGMCVPGECATTTPVRSFSVMKTASTAVVNPGGTVEYTITASNTGAVAYTGAQPAIFTDDLSGVLDDAVYNGDAAPAGVSTGSTLAWAVPIPVGGSVTVTYSVTVNSPSTGDSLLRNAVLPGVGGNCVTPGGCTTDTASRSYTVTKAVDADTSAQGRTLTYTITVENTGAADYTDADPASFTDDLSDVLEGATYNGDASNGATYSAPELSWAGRVDVGETATVTYSVTVTATQSDGDAAVLTNAVVTPIGGSCISGEEDGCVVTTRIVPPEVVTPQPGALPFTGASPWLWALAATALLAILAGFGITVGRRHSVAD